MATIRRCLDSGETFPWISTEISATMSQTIALSCASICLELLDSLPTPVVPFDFYQKCIDAYSSFDLCVNIASDFPEPHRLVFNYMTTLLAAVSPSEPAICSLAVVMIKSLKSLPEKVLKAVSRKKVAFLSHFVK